MDRPRTGQSSDRPQPSPTRAEGFALGGPSDLPDPAFAAFRRDIADVSLAGRVIASHFVEPVEQTVLRSTPFRVAPDDGSEVVADLIVGDRVRILECKLGWAWGYGGPEERVGYLKADAVGLE